MPRRVFFSFHYERDISRANVVRNSWVTKPDREAAGFWDASLWEKTKKHGEEAIKRLIDSGLENTSVTAVLVGAETATRRYVNYEISHSYRLGKGMLGVYINKIPNFDGSTDPIAPNPFKLHYVNRAGRKVYFSEMYETFGWNRDGGYVNLGAWIEQAARDAGR